MSTARKCVSNATYAKALLDPRRNSPNLGGSPPMGPIHCSWRLDVRVQTVVPLDGCDGRAEDIDLGQIVLPQPYLRRSK